MDSKNPYGMNFYHYYSKAGLCIYQFKSGAKKTSSACHTFFDGRVDVRGFEGSLLVETPSGNRFTTPVSASIATRFVAS